MGELWRRLRYLWDRGRMQRELEEEMAAHRAEMREPGAFGAALRLREEANDTWGFRWLDHVRQDIHYTSRGLRRSPGFTFTAIAVLAFGIGLNVTAFGFLNASLFRPLPGIRDPHTLMRLTRRFPAGSATNISYPAYDFYRRHSQAFSAMIGIASGELAYGESERWNTKFVSANYFSELGTGPAYGRLDRAEAGDVVISHAFFLRRFGGDTSILGKPLLLGRKAARVTGVTEAAFHGLDPDGADAWAAIEDHAHFFEDSKLLTSSDIQPLHLYGRLAPGVSPKAAEDAMRPLVTARRQAAPREIVEGEFLLVEPGAYAVPRSQKIRGPVAIASVLLLLVLATAAANLGNLLLARNVTREREFAIRAAVGASRTRIVRQLMTESVALALLGSAAGVALSMAASRIIVRALEWPAFVDATPDWRVAGFAFGSGLIASLFFGLAPALRATQTAKARGRLRLTLIGAQAAASCILLIVSGLLIRGLHRAIDQNPGFAFEQSAVVDANLYDAGLEESAARLYFDELRSRVLEAPGVESAALATIPPLGRRMSTERSSAGLLLVNHVGPEYFDTMAIRLMRGRTFRGSETGVIILGERTAAKLWPNEDAIGKEYVSIDGKNRWIVAGVAADAPIYSPGDPDAMEIYYPIREADIRDALLLVRTSKLSDAHSALRQAANSADFRVIPSLTPMRDGMDRRLRHSRITAVAASLLGIVSLTLAVIGFAGLVAFAVRQRTREIGIRLALGASSLDVMRIGLDRLLLPTSLGLAIGAAGSAAIGSLLRSQLYGLSSLDPISFVAAPALFLLLALLFSMGALRRAARVDPSAALRHD